MAEEQSNTDLPEQLLLFDDIPVPTVRELKRRRRRKRLQAWRARDPESYQRYKSGKDRRHRERHHEHILERDRTYHASVATEVNARRREEYALNPEPQKSQARLWGQKYPDRRNAKNQSYYVDHKEEFRVYRLRRRARKLASPGRFTHAEWKALVIEWQGRCAYCGDNPERLEREHRIPLGREGTNDISNILPACHKCNARKHMMTEEEFRALLAKEREDASGKKD